MHSEAFSFLLSTICVFTVCIQLASGVTAKRQGLHPRSKHIGRYDFYALGNRLPELVPFMQRSKRDELTIDFTNPVAVKCLNKAILLTTYNIEHWNIPNQYLCPPIPGRADYLHHLADLLSDWKPDNIPTGSQICCLDIGVGANMIYPIIGHAEYGWSFVGTDINDESLNTCQTLIDKNLSLREDIQIRKQCNTSHIFQDIILSTDKFDITMCNPPFHDSMASAEEGTQRKWKNLGIKTLKTLKNFGGLESELCYPGGELGFIKQMITESTNKNINKKVLWFTTLVSKEANLVYIYQLLKKEIVIMKWETIEISHGNKRSRIVAWTCLTKEQREQWVANWVSMYKSK